MKKYEKIWKFMYNYIHIIIHENEISEDMKKEEIIFANFKCTCMRFEANCYTGKCRNCGFSKNT